MSDMYNAYIDIVPTSEMLIIIVLERSTKISFKSLLNFESSRF